MNQLVTYRPQPLAQNEFQHLDRVAERRLSFVERNDYAIVRERDEYGHMVERRKPMITGGPEVFKRGDVSPRLMESILRPVDPRHLAIHLVNLSHHKAFARGEEAWRVVCADIMRDLEGVSEYALIKCCEYFRRQTDTRFFPDSAVFVRRVRDLDFSLRHVAVDKPAEKAPAQEPKAWKHTHTAKSKMHVARMCRLALKPKAIWTAWEQRFMDAMGKKAT